MRMVISYSITNSRWRDRLRNFLAPLEDGKLITDLWDRACIQAGQNSETETMAAFRRADLALVLISAKYLADKMLMQQELPQLLNERRLRGMTLILVILSPCLWESVPELRTLTPIPSDGRPLSLEQSVDAALHQVATKISSYAKQWRSVKPKVSVPTVFLPTIAKFDSANQETIITRHDEIPTLLTTLPLLTPSAQPRKKNKSYSYVDTLKTMATGAFLFDLGRALLNRLTQLARELVLLSIKAKVVIAVASTAGVAIMAVEHQRQEKITASSNILAPETTRTSSPKASSPRAKEPIKPHETTPERPPPVISMSALPLVPQPPHLATPERTFAPAAVDEHTRTPATRFKVPTDKVPTDKVPTDKVPSATSAALSSAINQSDNHGSADTPLSDATNDRVSGTETQLTEVYPRTIAENNKRSKTAASSVKLPTEKGLSVTSATLSSAANPSDNSGRLGSLSLKDVASALVPRPGTQLNRSRPMTDPESAIHPHTLDAEKAHLPDNAKVPITTKTTGACLEVTESYRVCLAGDGTVNKVEVLSGVANADIMASIKETKYKSQGKPRCFVKQLVNVSDESCVKKMVSAASIKEDKISRHDYPQISEALKRKLTDGGGAGGVITGSYKVCVGV